MNTFKALIVSVVTIYLFSGLFIQRLEAATSQEICNVSQFSGGMLVVNGSQDITLLKSLNDTGFTVQALVEDELKVQSLRAELAKQKLSGTISIKQFDGKHLPYIVNLVNVFVDFSGSADLATAEIERILTPRGVHLSIQKGVAKKVFTKPVPSTIDDWPMHRYGPANNPVSDDLDVAPPRHLQWHAGPEWTRTHELVSSLNAMVSNKGRVFYIMDEGLRASSTLTPDWMLVCRDAFNGVVLWKKKLPSWHTHLWPLKSGPAQLPRRIVAHGDSVFVPTGIDKPIAELDAATGKEIRLFANSEQTDELRIIGDQLFAVTSDIVTKMNTYNLENKNVWHAGGETGRVADYTKPKDIRCYNLKTGTELWNTQQSIVPTTLALDDKRVYFHNFKSLIALDRHTGKELWTSSKEVPLKSFKLGTAVSPQVVVYNNLVYSTQGFDYKASKLYAFYAETGQHKWTANHPVSGHKSPDDLMIINGLAWSGATAGVKHNSTKLGSSGVFVGRGSEMGSVKQTITPTLDQQSYYHQRCYPARATKKYMLVSTSGTEFVSLEEGDWNTNPWVRGACLYGIIPANGFLYSTPHPCTCSTESALRGFNALTGEDTRVDFPQPAERLYKGAAYDVPITAKASGEEWPIFRKDQQRKGYSKSTLGIELKHGWNTPIIPEGMGKLTPPIAAGGKVYVAGKETHALYAVNWEDGQIAWTYRSGGRIDSPPSYWNGRIIFGSTDGKVYCLNADSGELIWNYTVAPDPRQLSVDNQFESVWPLHGSLVVQDDTVYAIAGRSIFLDGGLHFVALDAATGNMKASERHTDLHTDGSELKKFNGGQTIVTGNNMILTTDGKQLYMSTLPITFDGERVLQVTSGKNKSIKTDKNSAQKHIFNMAGLLDDSWHHRNYWVYGNYNGDCWGGWANAGKAVPSGRVLVVDDNEKVYGFGRKPHFYTQTHVMNYQIFSALADPGQKKAMKTGGKKLYDIANHSTAEKVPVNALSSVQYLWRDLEPKIVGKALIGAGQNLYLAGPPEIVDEVKLFGNFNAPESKKLMKEKVDSLKGNKGGSLRVISMKDGKKRTEYPLDSPPIHAGMAAVEDHLFMSLENGNLRCFMSK